jgi:hypothetical protein
VLLLNLRKFTFEDFKESIEAVFERKTPYSAAFKEVMGEYCAAVGIAPRAVGAYLPCGCIRILNRWTYTPWTPVVANWI